MHLQRRRPRVGWPGPHWGRARRRRKRLNFLEKPQRSRVELEGPAAPGRPWRPGRRAGEGPAPREQHPEPPRRTPPRSSEDCPRAPGPERRDRALGTRAAPRGSPRTEAERDPRRGEAGTPRCTPPPPLPLAPAQTRSPRSPAFSGYRAFLRPLFPAPRRRVTKTDVRSGQSRPLSAGGERTEGEGSGARPGPAAQSASSGERRGGARGAGGGGAAEGAGSGGGRSQSERAGPAGSAAWGVGRGRRGARRGLAEAMEQKKP
ncbi:hypothetical protein VULLAG_LOCUS12024 [Vulpes lagopus]